MNVNLWGPSFWNLLHSLAFVADQKGLSTFDDLVAPLRDLLPCIHCRRSFAIYYEILGKPEAGNCAKWMYDVHNLVNDKLHEQAIDKTVATFAPGNMDFKLLLMTSMSALYPKPSFEVVHKRFFFQHGDLFSHKDISTVLLAFAFVAKDPNAPYTFEPCAKWFRHANALMNVPNLERTLTKLENSKDVFGEAIKFKYGQDNETTRKYASYLKAGACIDYTCQ